MKFLYFRVKDGAGIEIEMEVSANVQGHSIGEQDRSLALRSHDQIPAFHWSTPQNCFGGNLFLRFWRTIVSKILEEICFKDFEGKLFQRFFEEICF